MLVLTRHKDECILIGDDIKVMVIEIRGVGKGASVRLGIEAPKRISVDREEIRIAKQLNPRPQVAEAACDVEP